MNQRLGRDDAAQAQIPLERFHACFVSAMQGKFIPIAGQEAL